MVQEILVGIVFLSSLLYVGRLLYNNFQAKSACASGCGKCGAIDVEKLAAQIKQEGL